MFTILRSKCRLLRIPLMAGFLLIAASLVLAPAAEARNARKAHAAQSTASRQILNVRSAVLMDARTGKILYSQNPDVRIPPASLTKIMSMMVTFDAIRSGKVKLSDQIRVSRHAARQGGSRMGLRAGVTRQTVLCTTPFSFGMRKLEKSILWHTVCINRKRGVCSRRSVYAASPRSG